MKDWQVRVVGSVLALALALGLGAAPAATPVKAESSGKDTVIFAVGETVRVIAKRDQAELRALREAVDRMAKELEAKGYGKQRDLAQGVENALLREKDLARWKLGKAKIDSVLQERWEAPDGKEAWSVKVKISVALR